MDKKVMNEVIFKISFVTLWVTYILIRVPFDKQYKQRGKNKFVPSTIEMSFLVLMSIGLLIIPLVWVVTPLLNTSKMEFPVWLRIVGIVIAIASLFYFRWIHKVLGANWSPTLEIRKGHELIKTGPYKTIRHPMYTQIWLWTIAQVFIVSNLVAGFSGIIVWAIHYFVRVSSEERMMIEYFGDKYLEYMKKTGRIFPKVNVKKL